MAKDKKEGKKRNPGAMPKIKAVGSVLGGAAVGTVVQAGLVELADMTRESAGLTVAAGGGVGMVATSGNTRLFMAGMAGSGVVGYTEAKIEKWLGEAGSPQAREAALPESERTKALADASEFDRAEREVIAARQAAQPMAAPGFPRV